MVEACAAFAHHDILYDAAMSDTDEELSDTAARIAHDLNNLFGVIATYASFVHDEVSAAATGDIGRPWASVTADVARILVATEQAALLTDELQSAARRGEA